MHFWTDHIAWGGEGIWSGLSEQSRFSGTEVG